ncbi:MAG: hypothetical protein V7K67_18510 [Nostoc sp.]|uniref:hypothetical protein n=1 Tax=Nostoc sp. TaxID=1180 RepID=UPI002FF0E9FA
MQDFQPDETQPLLAGFKDWVSNPEVILSAILFWTGGQLFLTQKLCLALLVQDGACLSYSWSG